MTNTTSEPTQPYALTSDDVAALRAAESVCFHYYEQAGRVRAVLRGGYRDQPRIYTAREQRLFPLTERGDSDREREIGCETSLYSYGPGDAHAGGWRASDAPHARCFHMIQTARHNDSWTTVASLLRTGDQLTLAWIADNNTPIITDAGMYRDELRLVVTRGDKQLTFPIEVEVSVHNSARMIRRHG